MERLCLQDVPQTPLRAFNVHKFFAAMLAVAPCGLYAQSACSSDGHALPALLYERFINADCERCWTRTGTHAPGYTALVVDWIVPGALGDDAPLAAAATTAALERLQELQRPVPRQADVHISEVVPPRATAGRLRVAMSPAFNDYVGTGIRLRLNHHSSSAARKNELYRYTLILVELVPAASGGTQVGRNLVRNVLKGEWSSQNELSKGKHLHWMEARPMRIPDGAKAEQLALVGWVQNAAGTIVAAAQSVCR